jgi:2,3,4,5-tetrahydropyridine-2,6-dicarboxylate N-succinyltransferase
MTSAVLAHLARAASTGAPTAGAPRLVGWLLPELQSTIEQAWAQPGAVPAGLLQSAVNAALHGLNTGRLRVAERSEVGQWAVHQWVKQAVLLSFRLASNRPIHAGELTFYDKVLSKFAGMDEQDWQDGRVRVVPPAVAREGCYLAPNVVLMPSFVNIGAYVDEGTMVDAWANVGSCAQIGKNVHLAVGVCIGGVLEPLQANPTIIEDNCFIGANSSVVEGVIVEENSVIGMGVHLGQSTKIYDRATGEVTYGRIPAGSVVVPGTLPASDGSHATTCAVIVKRVDAQTRAKTGVNELLRT